MAGRMEDRSTSLRVFAPDRRFIEFGPPIDAWLSEIEDGYRYRYWIIEINVTMKFIAVTYERWMLITRIS